MLGFKTMCRGSEPLFKKLIKCIIEDKSDIQGKNIVQVYTSYVKDKFMDLSLLDTVTKSALKYKDEFEQFDLQLILTSMIKFGANIDHIHELEENISKKLEIFNLYNLSCIAYNYIIFSDKDSLKKGKHKLFLSEIERFYSINRENILETETYNGKDLQELKLM